MRYYFKQWTFWWQYLNAAANIKSFLKIWKVCYNKLNQENFPKKANKLSRASSHQWSKAFFLRYLGDSWKHRYNKRVYATILVKLKVLFQCCSEIMWLTVDGAVNLTNSSSKDFSFDWLIFLLYLLQSVCWSKYSAKATNFSISNIFISHISLSWNISTFLLL